MIPEEEKLLKAVARLNAKMLGLILGLLFGLVIFIATNWLLIRGGHRNPEGRIRCRTAPSVAESIFYWLSRFIFGKHYRIFYGFASGTLIGAMIGWVYNKIVEFRN